MKKIISLVLVCVLLVGTMLTLASCSNVTADYAEKINTAAENDEYITLEQVKKDLGKEAIEYTVSVLGSTSGLVIAVKGCESKDDIEAKLESGEKVEGLVIVILNNKATGAAYREIEEDDVK